MIRATEDREAFVVAEARLLDINVEVIAAETAETLSTPSGFPRRDLSRAELHVCNIRHMHHHAAQVSLRLKLDANVDIPWFASGWKTV